MGALSLAECFPAALPRGARERSSLPIIERYSVDIGADERREVARIAARLVAEDPALITGAAVDPKTAPAIENGPALFFEDHVEFTAGRSALFWTIAPVSWLATAILC